MVSVWIFNSFVVEIPFVSFLPEMATEHQLQSRCPFSFRLIIIEYKFLKNSHPIFASIRTDFFLNYFGQFTLSCWKASKEINLKNIAIKSVRFPNNQFLNMKSLFQNGPFSNLLRRRELFNYSHWISFQNLSN